MQSLKIIIANSTPKGLSLKAFSSKSTTDNLDKIRSDFSQKLKNGPQFQEFLSDQSSPSTDAVGSRALKRQRIPEWLRLKVPSSENYFRIHKSLRSKRLETVCEQAKCPNKAECWGGGTHGTATATIMIMGAQCTRACRFCSIDTSRAPPPLDPEEPRNAALAIAEWRLDYAVITSVDRDDVADGGAAHFVATLQEVRRHAPATMLEVLVPDFAGQLESVRAVVLRGRPDVLAHNVETVRRLQSSVRDRRANYEQSLRVLEFAKSASLAELQEEEEKNKKHAASTQPTSQPEFPLITKSNLMLGLGETEAEVVQAMRDMRLAGVDCLTIGQYLQSAKRNLKVKEFVEPAMFDYYRELGDQMGFLYTASGPLVRSSYKAGEFFIANILKKRKANQQTQSQLQSQSHTEL